MAIKCLMINGSGRGAAGNSAILLSVFKSKATDFEFRELNLVDSPALTEIIPHIEWAEVFVFATGTYWDSWGWPLQRFLESATATEGTSLWLGKPAAVLVTMHSVGGKAVLSRLQGVLNTFGALIPPMAGVVISAAGQTALQVADVELANDIWRTDDVQIVAANLQIAACSRKSQQQNFQTWQVDRAGFEKNWLQP